MSTDNWKKSSNDAATAAVGDDSALPPPPTPTLPPPAAAAAATAAPPPPAAAAAAAAAAASSSSSSAAAAAAALTAHATRPPHSSRREITRPSSTPVNTPSGAAYQPNTCPDVSVRRRSRASRWHNARHVNCAPPRDAMPQATPFSTRPETCQAFCSRRHDACACVEHSHRRLCSVCLMKRSTDDIRAVEERDAKMARGVEPLTEPAASGGAAVGGHRHESDTYRRLLCTPSPFGIETGPLGMLGDFEPGSEVCGAHGRILGGTRGNQSIWWRAAVPP